MKPATTRLHEALYGVDLVLLNEREVPGGQEIRLYRRVADSHNQHVATGVGWNGVMAKADCLRQIPEAPLEARLALAELACNNLLGALNR